MAKQFDRLSNGDLILVTGVSGLVGASVAEEALRLGFRVRGVSRDKSKLTQLNEKFVSQFGEGNFESVEVADITKPELFVPYLRGVAGVAHIATDTSFEPMPPREIIDAVVAATVGLMKEASKVPSIKAFTLTSSRAAAFVPPEKPGEPLVITKDVYFDSATETALSMPKDHPMLPGMAYVASKVEGEKAAWEYYNTAKPHYAFNTVLPDYVVGAPVNPRKGTYSTYTLFMEFYEGHYGPENLFYVFSNPASLYVDLQDAALAHIISLAANEVNGERIFAMTELYSVHDFAASIRKVKPDWKAPELLTQAMPRSNITVPNRRFVELVKNYIGRPLIKLDEIIEKTIGRE